MIFERVICKAHPGSKVSYAHCRVKHIDRAHLTVDAWANLSEPLKDIHLHGVAYFKYNTYQKIATEYYENLCDWLAGRHSSFLLDYTKPFMLKYTNFNHLCPYNGSVYVKIDNISEQAFPFPSLVPAGRYRIDFNFTEGNRSNILGGGSMYLGVSDHRVEVV